MFAFLFRPSESHSEDCSCAGIGVWVWHAYTFQPQIVGHKAFVGQVDAADSGRGRYCDGSTAGLEHESSALHRPYVI